MGDDLDIMIEYVNAAGEVTMGTNFGESYDKELALADEYFREGIEKGREENSREIAIRLFKNGVDINIISKSTGLSIDEINKLVENDKICN